MLRNIEYTYLLLYLGQTLALSGETGYKQALKAHPSPDVCPPTDSGGNGWAPDPNYIICCQHNPGAVYTATLTTARGPDGPIYACCQSDYICTGTAPFVSDWAPGRFTITFTMLPLETPPTPTGEWPSTTSSATLTPAPTATPPPTSVTNSDNKLTCGEIVAIAIGAVSGIATVVATTIAWKRHPGWWRPRSTATGE